MRRTELIFGAIGSTTRASSSVPAHAVPGVCAQVRTTGSMHRAGPPAWRARGSTICGARRRRAGRPRGDIQPCTAYVVGTRRASLQCTRSDGVRRPARKSVAVRVSLTAVTDHE